MKYEGFSIKGGLWTNCDIPLLYLIG